MTALSINDFANVLLAIRCACTKKASSAPEHIAGPIPRILHVLLYQHRPLYAWNGLGEETKLMLRLIEP